MRRRLALCTLLLIWSPICGALDHDHRAWSALLERHVVWLAGGHESRVAYEGFAKDRGDLQTYLANLSAVSEA